MADYQHIVQPFDPVFDGGSRVLVLGSFPSVLSRENAFYYGNPRNRFWRVAAACVGEEAPDDGDIDAKRSLLLRQVQIAAQLLYIPCGKEILQDLFGLAFPTDFSHPKKPLHIPMLGMPAPLGVVVRRFIHQDSWNLVNINPPGVECRGIRFSYSARPPVRSPGTMYPVLHAAPHSPPPDQRPLSTPDAPLTTGHTFCSRRPHSQKGFLASPEGPPLPDRMGNSRIHCLSAPYVLTLPQLVIESIPCPVIVSRVILPNRE